MKATQKITYFDTKLGKMSQEEKKLEVVDESTLVKQVESNVVCLYPDYRYQTMEGFGCAMTETSCYLLSKMDPETRKDALKCWFGEGGMDAKFVRIHMDSCDYSLEEYQAVEDPVADPELKTFSIKRDKKYIIPIMKEAMEVAGKEISVLLSPWSPPAAWKTAPEITQNDAAVYGGAGLNVDFSKPGRCFGGRLKPEYYASWAKYMVLFIQAYLAEGIPVTMVSVQNEANAATTWDSCIWSGEQEKTFLHDYLYPAMKEAGLTENIGIYIWDHNKERMIEHIDEMMQGDISDMIEGFAYHWYSGDHFEALSMIHEKYPDKILMHSESCGLHIPGHALGENVTPEIAKTLNPDIQEMFAMTPIEIDFKDARDYAHDIIGDMNHGMNRFIDWNMIVDRTGGPRHVPGGFCAPLIYEEDGTYTKTISYHYLKQIADAVHRDAVRIGMSKYCAEVECAAMKNTDGSIGILLLNRQHKELIVNIRIQGDLVRLSLPADTLSTVTLCATGDV